VNADGDGTGCEVALRAWLEERGIRAWIVNPTPYPRQYRFLLDQPEAVLDAASDEAKRRCREADLAVVVDTGEVSRLGRIKPLLDGVDRIVIDHHPPGERPITGTLLVDPEASAAGELVFELVEEAGGPWLPAVVDGLYVAILTDTGSFRFSNATPRAHRVAAELIERGAAPEELHRKVYGAHPLRALRLLEASLGTLEVDPSGRVAWMRVPRDAFDRLGATSEDLEGLVDYPRSVEGVEVGVLFRRTTSGETKVSLRSNGDVDVNRVARRFGGGGHAKAAGALLDRPVADAIDLVVEATLEAAGGAGGDRGGPG